MMIIFINSADDDDDDDSNNILLYETTKLNLHLSHPVHNIYLPLCLELQTPFILLELQLQLLNMIFYNELIAYPQQPPSWQDSLLDNWPRRSSSMSMEERRSSSMVVEVEADLATNTTSDPRKPPHVSFSAISQVFQYERHDDLCRKELAYNKEDRNTFKTEAKLEARRIRDLIQSAPPASAAESIEFLNYHSIMSKEELVGIESLVLGTYSLILKTRKLHSQIVLRKQDQQRHHNHQLEEDDPVMSLGRIAQQSSHKSANSARVRAAI
jgi:hypothetical protein